MGSPKPLPHRDVFEKHGVTGTQFKFAHLKDEVGLAANAWLVEQKSIREEEAAAKRDAREEETLSIAKMALVNSKRANISAIIVAIFTATATIIAALISIKIWS
jgi:hypothetical protein